MKRTTGLIDEASVVYSKGERCKLRFTYQVEGQVLEGIQSDLLHCDCDSLKSKRLEVIYDKTNPANVVLLITDSYYWQYELFIPDSLKWIERCGN